MGYDEQADLLTAYAATPDAIRVLLGSATRRGAGPAATAEGEWSIEQVMDHLAVAAEGTASRLRQMSSEDDPELVPFADISDPPLPLDESMRRFEAARAVELEVLRPASADWDRSGRHPQRGVISIRDIVRHMTSHDLEHLGQISRSLRG